MSAERIIVDCATHGRTEAFVKRLHVTGWRSVTINKCLRCEYPAATHWRIISWVSS